MKIAFVGLGSIGKRHFKNVHTYLTQIGQAFTADLYRHSLRKPVDEEFKSLIHHTYEIHEDLSPSTHYDAVFITNPTSAHYETVKKFVPYCDSMFIEKPVFDHSHYSLDFLRNREMPICYVACPLRYSRVISYIKDHIDCSKVYAVRSICSSYLPDWRSDIDYRAVYSAHKEMGGGVAIDLIHEWDYLSYLFGHPVKGYSLQRKISHLEINSEDIAVYIAQSEQTVFELHLDYFGRKSIRELQIFLPDETISCDILNGTIQYLNAGKSILLNSKRNDFQMKEIEHFFNIINHRTPNSSTIEHAIKVLKYSQGEF